MHKKNMQQLNCTGRRFNCLEGDLIAPCTARRLQSDQRGLRVYSLLVKKKKKFLVLSN